MEEMFGRERVRVGILMSAMRPSWRDKKNRGDLCKRQLIHGREDLHGKRW